MKIATGMLPAFLLGCALSAFGQNPAPAPQQPATTPPTATQGRGAGGDIGSGSGDIGKGAGEGVGKTAEGVGKGAGDLVTLHPVGAAENVGKGVGVGAKDVGVGAAKGTGKIAAGTGKLIAKPFHHHSKKAEAPQPAPSASEPPQ
jgi:hypothetical protein